MNFKPKIRWRDLILIGSIVTAGLFVALFSVTWLLLKLSRLACT
jgi:hypothetical protein